LGEWSSTGNREEEPTRGTRKKKKMGVGKPSREK